MKKIILFIFTISNLYPQCDANNDNQLDVLDVIVQVNCILSGCWE